MKTINKIISFIMLVGVMLFATACTHKSALTLSVAITGSSINVTTSLTDSSFSAVSKGSVVTTTLTLVNNDNISARYSLSSLEGVTYSVGEGTLEAGESKDVTISVTKGAEDKVTIPLEISYAQDSDILVVRSVTIVTGSNYDIKESATVRADTTFTTEFITQDASITPVGESYNFAKAGRYEVKYTATTSAGRAVTKDATIVVKDKPKITAINFTIASGVAFSILDHATAHDSDGKDISSSLTIVEAPSATVSGTSLTYGATGTYELTIAVTDPDLPTVPTEAKITVTVLEATTPKITASDFEIEVGEEIDLLDYATAFDGIDGDITSKIHYTLSYNGEEIFLWNSRKLFRDSGIYTIDYAVTNSSGNTSVASVKLTVKDMELQGTNILRNSDFSKDAYWHTNVENALTIANGHGVLTIAAGSEMADETLTSATFPIVEGSTYWLELKLLFAKNHTMRYEIQDASTGTVLFSYDFLQKATNTCDLLPYGTMAEEAVYGGYHASVTTDAVIVIYVGAGSATTLDLDSVEVRSINTTDKDLAIGGSLAVLTDADDYEFIIYRGFFQAMSYSRMWGYNSSISGEIDKNDGPYNAGEIEYCTLTFNVASDYVILLTDLSFVPNGLAYYVHVS